MFQDNRDNVHMGMPHKQNNRNQGGGPHASALGVTEKDTWQHNAVPQDKPRSTR